MVIVFEPDVLFKKTSIYQVSHPSISALCAKEDSAFFTRGYITKPPYKQENTGLSFPFFSFQEDDDGSPWDVKLAQILLSPFVKSPLAAINLRLMNHLQTTGKKPKDLLVTPQGFLILDSLTF